MPKKQKQKNKEKGKSERAMAFQSVRGMADILPRDGELWKTVLQTGYAISELYTFHFMETPILEPAGLFEAGVGAATDIVEKEMYVFKTKGGDRVALRPEGTAPLMRSYLEHHLGYFSSPLKVFHYGPMFRYERPQAGRYRAFHQWDFDIVGDGDPLYDVEIMLACIDFLAALKIKNTCLRINTIGCRVCRPTYREKLKNYYRLKRSELCKDCERRFDRNPLRLLDCKEAACGTLKEKAPTILDYLCQNCNNHFGSVLELIENSGIEFVPDPRLVRGLDYYNRTVFEITAGASPSALVGGGRYDYLSELVGGRFLPAVGGALGIERVIEEMKMQGISSQRKTRPFVFFTAVGAQAKKASLKLMSELRRSGICVMETIGKNSLKSQLKAAGKAEAPLALILGQREVFEGTVIVRDMRSSAQEEIVADKMIEEVKKRLRQ